MDDAARPAVNGFVACIFCGRPVNPNRRDTYRTIEALDRPGKQGGSDVVLRKPTGRYAHPHCVDLERAGINVRQETLV